jgi:transcriptional antiterminator NusG
MSPQQKRRRRQTKHRLEKSRLTAKAARRSLRAYGDAVELPQETHVDSAEAEPAAEPAEAPKVAPASVVNAAHRWAMMEAKPRFARRVVQDLAAAGIPALLTDEEVEIIEPNGRRRMVRQQLLRRVVFVGLGKHQSERAVARATYFVRDSVRDFAGRPMSVAPKDLAPFVESLAGSGTAADPSAFVQGDELRIKSPPLAGFMVTVEQVDYDARRLRGSVNVFGRGTHIELDFIDVERS